MSVINKLFKKKSGADLLKNKDFSAAKESGGAIRESGRTPAQSGRTMTEMLGTLAIIGVLSIGGIAGYNYAMDKYRANVTINDINLRAIDLITQSGRDLPLSLSEWSRTTDMGYTFSDPEWADDGSIALEISGLPEGVCEIVVDTLGERFDIEVGVTRYNGDNSICGENNTVTVFFEKTGAGVTCDPACKEGQVCEDGICMDEDVSLIFGTSQIGCTTNTDCPECMACTKNTCQRVANGATCSIGRCQNGNCKGALCSGNDACPLGSFCADSNANCESANPTQCKKLEVVLKKITLSNETSEAWYVSRRNMSWWDAQSFCSRLGKTMVTVDDLIDNWSGSSGYDFTRTERAQKLYDAIGGWPSWVWTSDIVPSDSCYAFFVTLSGGDVLNGFNGFSRSDSDVFALCH
ncbi:MAG: hypothetical protein ACI4QM_02660 [Alphaproteobacteria bacterium]